ncbi:MAG: hypothetical protein JSU66_05955 [Deltaproteobacteria bacterium]|nr:MAG: hypothetical protein JSU66_05955 [Deltaproteobacteria bacterium]
MVSARRARTKAARRITGLALAACLAVPATGGAQPTDGAERREFHGFYVLTFNRRGDLMDPLEQALAIQELRTSPEINRIVIFCYGWANDGESSYSTYLKTLREMGAGGSGTGPRTTAIIAVGWDSSQTGVRKLLNDLLPFPALADALAFVPDTLLFPLSFWSKSAQADRIGFGGLRNSLNEIFTAVYPDPETRPDVYLVGHSFGTRVLSGLMQDRMLGLPVQAEAFVAADRVKGAVLLQPALVPANLHRSAEYPVMVTQSRHDNANGFLYPLANALINAYSFTGFEGLFEYQVLSPIQSGIETTVGTVADVVTSPRDRADADAEPPPDTAPEEPTLRSRAALRVRRLVAEVLSVPATLAFTLVALPANYAYEQTRALVTHPIDHVMDTLAQLPLVEIPVYALDRALGREVRWGTLSKGFLSFGALHEASGHAAAPGLAHDPYPVYTPRQLEAFSADASPCGLPVCEGVFGVEASSIVRTGSYGQDLENPWIDFTIGWLDLIGAHGDYKRPEVVDLMRLMVRNRPAPQRDP